MRAGRTLHILVRGCWEVCDGVKNGDLERSHEARVCLDWLLSDSGVTVSGPLQENFFFITLVVMETPTLFTVHLLGKVHKDEVHIQIVTQKAFFVYSHHAQNS